MLIRREGIEVAGENDGYSGRNHTGYVYEGCRIKGVTVGTAGTPLISAATKPGTGGVPVAKSGSGLGVSTEVEVPEDNAANKLENQKTTTKQADGRVTEITVDKFGQPKLTRVSGPGTDPAEMKQEQDDNGLVTIIQYPEGRIHRMSYDTNNPVFRSRGNLLKTEVEPGPRGGDGYTEVQAYDPRYNLPSGAQRDANGFVTTYQLSADGRFIRSIRHGDAGTELSDFNDRGQLQSHTDVDGLESSLTFNSATGFLETTKKGPNTKKFTYGGNLAARLGQPSTTEPPRGAPSQFVYNANLQEVEITRGVSVQKLAYDEQGRSTHQVEELGDGKRKETRLVIDAKGFVSDRKIINVEVNGADTTLEYVYTPDELSRVRSILHPGGTVQKFRYNALGHMTRMELETYVEEYKTDRHGNIVEVKNGGDVVATTAYDGLDRAITISALTGTQTYLTERSYFPAGELRTERVTDPGYGVVADRVVTEIDALGRVLASTVNGTTVNRSDTYTHGVLSRTSKGPRQTITERWNAAGYPTGQTDSIETTTLIPDGNGNVERQLREEDGASYSDNTTFTDLDHPETMTDNLGPIVTFVPRADGLNLEIKNARNNTTRMEYSALGEVVRRRRADGLEFRFRHDERRQVKFTGDPAEGFGYDYDSQFRLVRRTQRNGAATIFSEFDPRNLPKTITMPGGTMTQTYDRQRRMTNSTVAYGSTTYATGAAYDALGRARVQTYRQDGGAANLSTSSYDTAGPLLESRFQEDGATFTVGYGHRNDLTRNSISYPSGLVLREDRDGTGRLVGLSSSLGPIVEVKAWQGNSQPKTVVMGGVIQTDNQYDARGRLMASRSVRIAGGRVLAHLRYQYDAANNVEIRQHLHRAGRIDNFSYDDGERLARAQMGGIPTATQPEPIRLRYQRTYNYSPDGLDLLVTAPVLGPPVSVPPFAATWTAHDAFLLPASVDGVGRNPPDAMGRVSQARAWVRPAAGTDAVPTGATFQHNGLGQLVRVERADGVVEENHYQPGGLRFLRKITQGGLVIDSRHYVYGSDGRLLEEYDRSGAMPRLLARYYYFDHDAPCVADLADATGQLRRYYYLCDDVHSVVAIADRDGVAVERAWYDPFGQPVIEPRDDTPPVIKRVVGGAGGTLLIELTEPVTTVVADPGIGTGIRKFNPSFTDLVTEPADGTTDLPESVPGYAPYSVIVFTPKEPLAGAVQLTLAPGRLTDDWDNHLPSQTVTLAVTGAPGETFYTAAGSPATGGEPVARSLIGSPFLFHGQYFDYETGLIYLRARFYDPAAGMFLEPDPLGYEDSVNLYAGLGNNPISNRDPSGLQNGMGLSYNRKRIIELRQRCLVKSIGKPL